MIENSAAVIAFWFEELEPKERFKKSEELDLKIKQRFLDTHNAVVAGETDAWRENALGRLAEVIVLDQFSRNMFRDSPAAFAFDSLALALAQEAIRSTVDTQLPEEQRTFLYMPFMHSESLKIHEQALELFADLDNYNYEVAHWEIIKQFGRYPHRNTILGRESTQAEIDWLATNSGF